MGIVKPIFRLATLKDLAVLPEIEKRALNRFRWTKYEILRMTPSISQEVLIRKQKEDNVWVMDLEASEPKGFAILTTGATFWHLEDLAITEETGRRGYGTLFLKHLIKCAEQKGFSTLSLSTYKDIGWNAPFYFKNGFKEMSESELTPFYQKLRGQEKNMGMNLEERVLLNYELQVVV